MKSKKEDNWFKRHPAISTILILLVMLYFLSLFNNSSEVYDERIGDLDNYDKIKIHIEILEEYGYEVVYYYYAEPKTIEGGSLTMKSLGQREMQIARGLGSLGVVYPNAPKYTIVILEPTRECSYIIPRERRSDLWSLDTKLSEFEYCS